MTRIIGGITCFSTTLGTHAQGREIHGSNDSVARVDTCSIDVLGGRMHAVATLLPRALDSSLRKSLGSSCVVSPLRHFNELGSAAAFDLLVIDPTIPPTTELFEFSKILMDLRTPLVLFGSSTASFAERTVRLLLSVPQVTDVVIVGGIDLFKAPAMMFSCLRSAAAPALVLQRLAPEIHHLPAPMMLFTLRLLSTRPIARTSLELMRLERLSVRSVTSSLNAAGLCGVKTLLMIARIAHSWAELRQQQGKLGVVAENAHYATVRAYRNAFESLIGLPPTRARDCVCLADFARALSLRALNGIAPNRDRECVRPE